MGASIVDLKAQISLESHDWPTFLLAGAKRMGLCLTEEQAGQLKDYTRELLEWNNSINLTSITDPVIIAEKQFLDALFLVPNIAMKSRVLDVGSGNGVPGIPLKIARPDLDLCLVDGSRKKISFLKHIIRSLGLAGIEARWVRTEQLAQCQAQQHALWDVIVSKAAFSLDQFITGTLPLMSTEGKLIAMKGFNIDNECDAARKTMEREQLEIERINYELPFCELRRTLIVVQRKLGKSL